ncbi:MAG: DUF87 domain-containing protein [Vulcanisaeta sp.]|nr:DUF87 domain-containing protein [Vulcanisaeta sp.]
MDRTDIFLAVGVLLLIIGIEPALRFVAVLGALLILVTPGVGRRILERVYGPRLAPLVTGMTSVAGVAGSFNARGLAWRFYRAYPRLSIDVHRQEAVKALNGLIQVLPLDAGVEVVFARLGTGNYVGVGVPPGVGLEGIITILNRYFLLEPAPASEVRRLIGGGVRPITSDTTFAILFLASIIGGLFLFGSPLRVNWPWGVGVALLLGITLARASGGVGVAPPQHSYGLGVTHSDAMFREVNLDAILATAEQNAGRDFVLVIGRARLGRESIASQYAQAINRWVIRQMGEYVPKIQALDIAHRRAQSGEVFITFSIYGSLTLPGMTVGRPLRHWLFGPSLDGLSMDVCGVPVFYGENVIAQGDELVVLVGRDEYGTPVVIGLNSAPSPHFLIAGPTGSGKSWAGASLMLRAHRLGVPNILTVDPQGEYPGYFEKAGVQYNAYDVLDAFIDWLEPVTSPTTHADKIASIIEYAYGSKELANQAFEDLIRLYEAYPKYPGLYEALEWLARNGEAKRVWLVARELAPKRLLGIYELTSGVNVLVLRRVMNYTEYAKLVMQALLYRLYYEYLQRPFVERLNTIVAFDEAYLIIESPILELVVRGVRKLGFGVWVMTQTLGDVKREVLQNFGFVVLLQGLAPHAESVGRAFSLERANIDWLAQGNSPRVFGGEYTPGILIYPPRPRRVFIKLEPVKS